LQQKSLNGSAPRHSQRHRLAVQCQYSLREYIPVRLQPLFPGDQELERRIRALSAGTRWPWWCARIASSTNIGGHISTYASAATLYEVGFNHFFRARTDEFEGDTVYFQGHASPGIYARAFWKAASARRSWKISGAS